MANGSEGSTADQAPWLSASTRHRSNSQPAFGCQSARCTVLEGSVPIGQSQCGNGSDSAKGREGLSQLWDPPLLLEPGNERGAQHSDRIPDSFAR